MAPGGAEVASPAPPSARSGGMRRAPVSDGLLSADGEASEEASDEASAEGPAGGAGVVWFAAMQHRARGERERRADDHQA